VIFLRGGCHFHLCLPAPVRLRNIRWNEINRETPKIEGKYEGDDPVHNCSHIMFIVISEDPQGDGQTDFDNYKKEFDSEGGSYYTVLAIVDSGELIFPADPYH